MRTSNDAMYDIEYLMYLPMYGGALLGYHMIHTISHSYDDAVTWYSVHTYSVCSVSYTEILNT